MESHLFYFGVFDTAAGFGCIKYLIELVAPLQLAEKRLLALLGLSICQEPEAICQLLPTWSQSSLDTNCSNGWKDSLFKLITPKFLPNTSPQPQPPPPPLDAFHNQKQRTKWKRISSEALDHAASFLNPTSSVWTMPLSGQMVDHNC